VSDAQITANLTVIHRQAPESGIPTVSAAIRERGMPLFAEWARALQMASLLCPASQGCLAM
jgi:hypothetical protein